MELNEYVMEWPLKVSTSCQYRDQPQSVILPLPTFIHCFARDQTWKHFTTRTTNHFVSNWSWFMLSPVAGLILVDVILLAVVCGKSGWKSYYLPHHTFPIFSCYGWREPLQCTGTRYSWTDPFFPFLVSLATGDDEKHKKKLVLPDGAIKGQGHLLSCSGQLTMQDFCNKMKFPPLYIFVVEEFFFILEGLFFILLNNR